MTRSRDVANIDTILTTKGDIYAASAAYTPTRLAVGNNGETLVADSSASTGLRYTAGNPIANPIINSGFDIAQRGTSFSLNNSFAYTLDRWYGVSNPVSTITQQATGDTTNLPNIRYCMRVQRNSGNTNTSVLYVEQAVETANAIPFAGKTVTLSFYARAGANYSPSSSFLQVSVTTGTGIDQKPYTGYTGSTNVLNQNATLTTTWQRFSFTATIGATATEFSVAFIMNPTGTAGANDYFEVTGVQVDIGSVALPYRRSGGTLAGELAACQRYYYRFNGSDGAGNVVYYGSGFTTSTTAAQIWVQNPVPMRVRPSSIDAQNLTIIDSATAVATTAVIGWNGPFGTRVDCTFTGLVANRPALLYTSSATGYLGFSAEL